MLLFVFRSRLLRQLCSAREQQFYKEVPGQVSSTSLLLQEHLYFLYREPSIVHIHFNEELLFWGPKHPTDLQVCQIRSFALNRENLLGRAPRTGKYKDVFFYRSFLIFIFISATHWFYVLGFRYTVIGRP